ncbi:MAG TPA: MerR family transcriptional regulator [Acidobacteriota bacterium]|nr:MerR family transcriptional regulator [Acidobacteriota bacterium]
MKKAEKKLFYKIGEVCKICRLEPHVLRYWETEFPALKPAKNRSGQRIYRKKDIEVVETIKHLVYERGYTIAGANQRLMEKGDGEPQEMSLFRDTMKAGQRRALGEIKKDVGEILQILES